MPFWGICQTLIELLLSGCVTGFGDEPVDGHWRRSKASADDWPGTEQGRTAAPSVTSITVSPDTACSSKASPNAWSTSRGGTSDRRSASDPAQLRCDSESPLLVTGQASARSPSLLVGDVTPSSGAEAGDEQRPMPDDSTTEGNDARTGFDRADWGPHLDLADSFSKSSRLKASPASEVCAPVGLLREPMPGGSMSAAAVSSVVAAGDSGTQPAIEQQSVALPCLARSALGASKPQATMAADASSAAEAELLSPGTAIRSSAGMPDVENDAQGLLGQQAGVQLVAQLLDMEQPGTAKQQPKQVQQPTAKQKKQIGDQQQAMAEDTPEMRSEFVKQLLMSAFDMDRQW